MRAILDETVTALQRLAELLAEETDRLKVRNIDGLDQLLAAKLEALQAANGVDQQRRRCLTDAGYDADETGMRRYLADQGDHELDARWQAALQLLQRVRALNEGNGRIIHRGLADIEQLLGVLRGDGGQAATTYGRTGQTKTSATGKTLSRA